MSAACAMLCCVCLLEMAVIFCAVSSCVYGIKGPSRNKVLAKFYSIVTTLPNKLLDSQVCIEISLFLARQPPVCQGFLIHEVSRSYKTTHHSRPDSSGRVISSSKRPLPDNTHNIHNRQTSIPPVGFEPTISAGERPQICPLDRATTGTGMY